MQLVRCWNLVGEPEKKANGETVGREPRVEGKIGALSIYHKAVLNTTFAGPTYFSGILRRFLSTVRYGMAKGFKEFYVLCIFTDGFIHDMAETKELVVTLSYLPVSIIILGIGDDNFDQMVELDADSHVLTDKNGRAAARDVIQFVAFNEMKDLAQERVNGIMMQELPD